MIRASASARRRSPRRWSRSCSPTTCCATARSAARSAPSLPSFPARSPETMTRQFKVAVVGATGAVGEALLAILLERQFPASEIVALASEKSAGKEVDFGRRKLMAQVLETYD